jgi:hypothetical protein
VTSTRNAIVRTTASGALSIVTQLGIAGLDRLPYSHARVLIRDALSIPGGVIGMMGSAVGLYDTPSLAWAVACEVRNLAFYSIIWWFLLKLVIRPGSRVALD